jgi:hypothetical protein
VKQPLTTVAISPEDLQYLREIAEEEKRSLTQQVSYWIKQHRDNKRQSA